MRAKTLIVVLAIIAGAGAAWIGFHRESVRREFNRTQNALPAETLKVLETGSRFVLFSIDPTDPLFHRESDPPPNETFHGYAVLGKAEIHDPKERSELLRALNEGIADSDGVAANCFNPRHGISATLDGETVDLVICFECLSIEIYAKDRKHVLTTDSPRPTFNRALERAHLPIAKQK